MTSPLSEAPLTGHPDQAVFDPATGQTSSNFPYNRRALQSWGFIPCAFLVSEQHGPSAVLIDEGGGVIWRDHNHRGRWVETDYRTVGGSTLSLCLIGGDGIGGESSYRTVRWITRHGDEVRRWVMPSTIPGMINGLEVHGNRMIVNVVPFSSSTACETRIFTLDGTGYPTGVNALVSGLSGADFYIRGYAVDTARNLLWAAVMVVPQSAAGTQGSVRAIDMTTGALVHEFYGHYPADVRVMPSGDIAWLDEHLDRARSATPETGAVRTMFAGSASRAAYEPPASLSANTAQQVFAGSPPSLTAVAHRGLIGLYAPNGIDVLTDDTFLVADTDNGRVVFMRRTSTYEPEVIGITGLFNEPTKARKLVTSASA